MRFVGNVYSKELTFKEAKKEQREFLKKTNDLKKRINPEKK